MFAGAGAYTTFELGGLLKADGFGTHVFSAGGTGNNQVQIRNTTAGTGNASALVIGNNTSGSTAFVVVYSTTYTPSLYALADGTAMVATGAGGLSLAASNASGAIRLYTGATPTEQMRIDASGGVMIGTTITSGAHQLNVGVGNITCGYDGGVSAYTLISSTGFEVDNAAGVTSAIMATGGFKMAAWPTTGSAANAFVGDTQFIQRSTSIRANKHDILPITVDDAMHTVMGLQPVLYRSRVDEDQRQWPGFIAENVAEVNPVLAMYGQQQDLQSVAYDRVPAYLVAVVQNVLARLAQLEAA